MHTQALTAHAHTKDWQAHTVETHEEAVLTWAISWGTTWVFYYYLTKDLKYGAYNSLVYTVL